MGETVKSYKRIGSHEILSNIKESYNTPLRGVEFPYEDFTGMSFKMGYHTIIASPPASGKSEFILSTLLKIMARDGSKAFIFSPEMGSSSELTATLVTMLTGKTIYEDKYRPLISSEEYLSVITWLDEHVIILEPDYTIDIEGIYEQYDLACGEFGHMDYIVIDNLNDIREPIDASGRQDLGIEMMLSYVRNQNRIRNCHTIMVTHSSHQGSPVVKGGIRFYPPITPEEIRGGRATYRKGYLMLTLWRPPYGLNDEEGRPYEKNEVKVIVLKGKPNGTALKGFEATLYYNYKNMNFSTENPFRTITV